MKKNNEQRERQTLPITELLQLMLVGTPLEYGIEKLQVKEAWFKHIGPWGSKHTQSVELKGSVLYVRLNSAVVKENISYKRGKIIGLLNEELGKEVVTELVLL